VAPAPHLSPLQQLVVALRRTADEHDERAARLDAEERPERAAWHRIIAKIDRARADRLEEDQQQRSPSPI
jgi:hypothetical protein